MRDGDLLHAYVDGQLDPARRIEVEAWLAEDEAAAARVDAYRAQNAALHHLFDPVLKEPLDGEIAAFAERLGDRLAGRERPRWWLEPGWQRLAASVAFVAVGLGAGWLGHGQMATPSAVERPAAPSFAEEATQAHTFYANSRFEVEMGGDDQDALNAWLSERLGRAVFAPDLTSVGYKLKGGRSLPTDSGAVVLYMYETSDGARLTLVAGMARQPQQPQQAAVSFAKRGDISSFYWTEGPLSYALVGRMDRDPLIGVAQLIHHKLKGGPPHSGPPQNQPAPETQQPPPQTDPAMPQPGAVDQGRPKAS